MDVVIDDGLGVWPQLIDAAKMVKMPSFEWKQALNWYCRNTRQWGLASKVLENYFIYKYLFLYNLTQDAFEWGKKTKVGNRYKIII